MIVSDVVNLVKSKSFGTDENSPEMTEKLLGFTNQAHTQMWDAIAHLSDDYLEKGAFTFKRENEVCVLNRGIKARLRVYDPSGKRLSIVPYGSTLETPSLKTNKTKFYVLNRFSFKLTYVFLNDIEEILCSYFYTPEAALLSIDTDLTPIYPLRLQYLLADGAFYHQCFAEEGTRPIRQQDKSALTWERDLAKEKASLVNARPFSTYGIC